jgi:hypothetical protein
MTKQQVLSLEDVGLGRGKVCPSILTTCKTVYNEAASIFYSENIFRVTQPNDLSRFSIAIGPDSFKAIRSLFLQVKETAEIAPWLDVLEELAAKATGLRVLQVEMCSKFDFELVSGNVNFIGGVFRPRT